MPTVMITGGTGTIGKQLSRLLSSNGYEVIIVTRSPGKHKSSGEAVRYAAWDLQKGNIDDTAFAESDYIINLAGAGVADKRWSDARRKEIVSSRTQSGDLLIKYLKEKPNKVKAVISASATGFYGEDPAPGAGGFAENDKPAADFLAKTCQVWEQHIEAVQQTGKRLVILRTGIVLSNEGGAFVEFKKPLGFGFATILGSGKQTISWIHAEDICRMYLYAIEQEQMSGIYNAVAPQPVSNKTLILEIAKARNRFYIPFRVPEVALKIALGAMSAEILKSATVSSGKIERSGFQFTFPEIEDAVLDLIAAPGA